MKTSSDQRVVEHIKWRSLLMLAILLSTASIINSLPTDNQLGNEPIQFKSSVHCPKTWIFLSNSKCYRLIHNSRNYSSAKAKCMDMNSQLATIDDDSNSSAGSNPNESIMSYLNAHHRKTERTKNYYVTLTDELMRQFQKNLGDGYYSPESQSRYNSESTASKLWLPRDDSVFSNLTFNVAAKPNYTAFALAYSRNRLSWGIVPVYPSKKLFYICERNPTTIAPSKAKSEATRSNNTDLIPSSTMSPNLPPASIPPIIQLVNTGVQSEPQLVKNPAVLELQSQVIALSTQLTAVNQQLQQLQQQLSATTTTLMVMATTIANSTWIAGLR